MATLQGKSALVTGSGGGIGLELAKALAARGANIILNDIRDAADVSDIKQDIESTYGVEVLYAKADVTNPADVEAMMKMAKDRFGRLDILVNNAGIQRKHPLPDFPIDQWEAVLKTNLFAIFYATKYAIDLMPEGGTIINIASVNGHVGSPDKSAYCTAKGGAIQFTRQAAVDLHDKQIRVFSVSPGFVDTPLARQQVKDFQEKDNLSEADAINKLLEFQQVKEFISLEALGNVVANLSALPVEKAMALSGGDVLIDNGWRDNIYTQRPPQISDAVVEQLKQTDPADIAA